MVNTHIRNIDISTISRGVMKRTEEFESLPKGSLKDTER